jgi:hypothetical protein
MTVSHSLQPQDLPSADQLSTEEGGWGDHVTPFIPSKDTPGEWIVDPYTDESEPVPVGPGEFFGELGDAGHH